MKLNRRPTFKPVNGFKDQAEILRKASCCTENELYDQTATTKNGLDDSQVKDRLETYGYNEVRQEGKVSWLKQLLSAFINPFIGILIFIAIISAIIDIWLPKITERDYSTVIMVCIMVTVSVALRFIQEYRSNKAAEKLKDMVETTATIERNGEKFELDIKDIVPGDIIHLSAGDMIPADCRIINAKDLFVIQSALTGESLPIEKKAIYYNTKDAAKSPIIDLQNICYMGTNVISGTATAVVVTTGEHTYFGSISKTVTGKRQETSFDKGLKRVSYLLISFMAVMVPVVFIINGFAKDNWIDAMLFAVAIAVGLTPEMLPMIVTANLAKELLT